MEHGKFGDRGGIGYVAETFRGVVPGVDYGCGFDHFVTYCIVVTFDVLNPPPGKRIFLFVNREGNKTRLRIFI